MLQQRKKGRVGSGTIVLCTLLLLGGGFTNAANAAATDEGYFRWQDTDGANHFGDAPPKGALNPQQIATTLPPPRYRVERVIDGDTIAVRHGGKVRLLGINAPEIAHRDRVAEPLGERAHQRLRELLQDQQVYLEFDQQRRDRYERLLAHISLEDGTSVNELLLREGLARALFLQPNMRHLQRYFQAEAEAREARRGIWSRPEFQVRPATRAKACAKQFCLLQGVVQRVERKRTYTYLQLPGKLRVSIKNRDLPQFLAAGVNPHKLEGRTVIVRGWVGEREGSYTLRLQHPLQIQTPPPT
ncbi:MAG: thermonuclease family protein [Gammaproteobacteria bacterium]|nr:thermonuclease family protein [Gammaproteobacteria bacterium]